MKILLPLLLLLSGSAIQAQTTYKYRLFLSDKPDVEALLEHPEQLLSERALSRRARQHIGLDGSDVPVSPSYLSFLRERGYEVVTTSRWMNTVVIGTEDSIGTDVFEAFPFVDKAELVWKENQVQKSFFIEEQAELAPSMNLMREQILIHHGELLHDAGYRGEGMVVAVIDAGFLNIDKNADLLRQVVGTRDFVDPRSDIFSTHPHGARVLSTMASSDKSRLWGSAPNASYWLLRSEDSSSEFPVEEDYWIAAAEFADSVGVDVINSSLGYCQFDAPAKSYTWDALDGKTAYITRGASFAARKGMVVVNSAGNERAEDWERLGFPGDCPDILTVGAINPDRTCAYFSGAGFTDKGFVKPDVMALGNPAYVIYESNTVSEASGTSFSAPILAGLVTCLWQSLPHLDSNELLSLIRENSSSFATPDSLTGYGVPDMYQAFVHATGTNVVLGDHQIQITPYPLRSGVWRITGLPPGADEFYLQIFNTSGIPVFKTRFRGEQYIFNMDHFGDGLYIVNIRNENFIYSQRINHNRR